MGVFVQVDGIEGDSKFKNHENWIVAESCTIPTTRPETQTTMGKVTDRTRANVDFDDVQLKKSMDMASPFLMHWNLQGKGRKVTVHFTDENNWYLEYVMENTILTKLDIDADAEGTATETLSLDFTKIEYVYRTKSETGDEYEVKGKRLHYDISTGVLD